MENKKLTVFLASIPLAIIFTFGCTYATLDGGKSASASATMAESPQASIHGSIGALPDFADIAERQGAAVVNISVSSIPKATAQGIQGLPGIDPNDPFYEFFRRFQIPAPQNGAPTHGLGSGFIVSTEGIVLTNAHVVANADEVTVKLTDKREFKAKVLGVDKLSDVAVLKINASNLPTVKVGDVQKARVGEWVVAIGSPFGFENSVTAGIISAKSRTLPDEGYVPFLQTDVAINPGNSGGPLFNMNGEVIGINSQIYTRSGGYQGLSFAIPIDVAMKIEEQLVAHGKVSHGRLGVTIQEVNQELASSFGLDKPMGALVSSVEKDSPAEQAGIEAGDVILKFNGKDIARSSDLPPLVAGLTPGALAKVELWHKGRNKSLSMNVGEMKSPETEAEPDKVGNGKLGLVTRPLTLDERRQSNVAKGEGVLVERAVEGPAAHAGIRSGDIILSVNGMSVDSPEQLNRLANVKGKRYALHVLRGNNKLFVPVSIE